MKYLLFFVLPHFLFAFFTSYLKYQYPTRTSIFDDDVEIQQDLESHVHSFKKVFKGVITAAIVTVATCSGSMKVHADDELATYAAQGNEVGVDGQCFFKKCALETSSCANNPNCLKGLSCLARCKGGSLCSTGCFAKYGSESLDNLLYCSVEKNDCVHVPGKESLGWTVDTINDLPSKPSLAFNIASLQGTWYKIMGLDSRYDCFDCQRNKFEIKNKETLKMEAIFRIPRQTSPGYLQSKIIEELHATSKDETYFLSHLQSKGRMFGLTFWENWYILGDSASSSPTTTSSNFNLVKRNQFPLPSATAEDTQLGEPEITPDLRLVFYTGHTLQGSYKGAFVLSRSSQVTSETLEAASFMIRKAGMSPGDFCIIRNQCFLSKNDGDASGQAKSTDEEDALFWFIGQKFFRVTKAVAQELADWFEDPALLSDWLVNQQQRMVFEQPLAVSPFAGLE